MRSRLASLVAVIYLASLWAYQLPRAASERGFMKFLRPVQEMTFTNRQYRMYAPDPRPSENIPILLLKTSLTPVRFLKTAPGRGELNFFSREKWANFVGNLVRAQTDEKAILSPAEGWEFFRLLAARICRDESDFGDRVLSVSLQVRPVQFMKFQEDIAWGPPEPLEDFECP